MSFNSNPEHASFAEYGAGNCYADSEIGFNGVQITIHSKVQSYNDNVHNYHVMLMPIVTAFPEDISTTDPITATTVGSLLRLTNESTHR